LLKPAGRREPRQTVSRTISNARRRRRPWHNSCAAFLTGLCNSPPMFLRSQRRGGKDPIAVDDNCEERKHGVRWQPSDRRNIRQVSGRDSIGSNTDRYLHAPAQAVRQLVLTSAPIQDVTKPLSRYKQTFKTTVCAWHVLSDWPIVISTIIIRLYHKRLTGWIWLILYINRKKPALTRVQKHTLAPFFVTRTNNFDLRPFDF